MRMMLAVLLLLSSFAKAQRLPDTVVPEHYQLTLTPDLQKKTFQGEETIRIRLQKATPTVTLNAAERDRLLALGKAVEIAQKNTPLHTKQRRLRSTH